MQIKGFTIPINSNTAAEEELNLFLRSKKILNTDAQLVTGVEGTCWCFCIRYIEAATERPKDRKRVDYMEVLDPVAFKRFSRMREVRKQLAVAEAIPAYATKAVAMAKASPIISVCKLC